MEWFDRVLAKRDDVIPSFINVDAINSYVDKSMHLDQPEMTGAETAADIALGFAPGIGTAMGFRDFERARRDDDKLGMGLGILSMLPVVGGAVRPVKSSISKAGKNVIKAYHGSPHSFDKFSLDKIGAGNEKQAYGHGLYFADNEDVAKIYKQSNSATAKLRYDGKPIRGETRKSVAWWLEHLKGDKDAVKDLWERSYKPEHWKTSEGKRELKILDELDYSKLKSGNLYEVNINADPDTMLDWHKPLSEQSDAVIGRYSELKNKGLLDEMSTGILAPSIEDTTTGQQIYSALAKNPEAASAELLKSGIPGIKYSDNLSTGAKKGTSNYVIFDDSLIDIIKKYGFIPPALMAAGMIPEQAQASQNDAYDEASMNNTTTWYDKVLNK